ncbi:MAG: hypothetical protein NC311_03470 [Muribaculaceae bacterium]|nr:hypothetical protein [Muribaculaceae bacterium]
MAKKQPQISVNFCTYMPYDEIPYTCINMGQIDTTQLNTLMDAFATGTNKKHTCIETMSLDFRDTMSFGKMPGSRNRYRTLDLSDMFYFYDVREPKFRAPCMSGPRLPQNSDAMTRACAHNLRCGKCRDEFIRRTLGAILFPEKYAIDKQK